VASPALKSSALEEAGAVVTETSLRLSDPTALTWEHFERLGQFLGTLGQAYCWWVGDLLVYGEEIFGEEFAQIEATLPHSEHTLQNYRWVASRIPRTRRRTSLGFGVHEAVAALEPKERDHWLDLAEQHGWKRQDMRNARRAAKALPADTTLPALQKMTSEELQRGVEEFTKDGKQHLCPVCKRPLEE
jgi:hypothetical protein